MVGKVTIIGQGKNLLKICLAIVTLEMRRLSIRYDLRGSYSKILGDTGVQIYSLLGKSDVNVTLKNNIAILFF